MLYILLVIAWGIAGYFGLRYYLLKKSLRKVNDELHEVMDDLNESRIVKLPSPEKSVESLLETINAMLDEMREETVEQGRREDALKSQIESISHDLRTPLTSIQGYLSLVDTSRLDGESTEALEVVRRKAGSLQRLIVQFYELSQLSHEDDLPDLRPCNTGYLLKETLTAHYRMLSENSLEVILRIPETPLEATVDIDALERIFSNLIENASRYALSKLEIALQANKDQVEIIFSNDCELSEDIDPEKLFVPFYINHSSRPEGSSGLGLSIARKLAENMNAHLEATLDQEAGSQIIHIALTLAR